MKDLTKLVAFLLGLLIAHGIAMTNSDHANLCSSACTQQKTVCSVEGLETNSFGANCDSADFYDTFHKCFQRCISRNDAINQDIIKSYFANVKQDPETNEYYMWDI